MILANLKKSSEQLKVAVKSAEDSTDNYLNALVHFYDWKIQSLDAKIDFTKSLATISTPILPVLLSLASLKVLDSVVWILWLATGFTLGISIGSIYMTIKLFKDREDIINEAEDSRIEQLKSIGEKTNKVVNAVSDDLDKHVAVIKMIERDSKDGLQ